MSLKSVFNHLVLPPRLPGCADRDADVVARAIFVRVRRACDQLCNLSSKNHWQGQSSKVWASLNQMLLRSYGIHDPYVEAKRLVQEWEKVEDVDLLIVNIAQQNAALMLHQHHSDSEGGVIFEVFETSPSSKDVLAANGALVWQFPERAVMIPCKTFTDVHFQENLATFLEQASQERLQRFAAHTRKAGVTVIETRDTTDPALLHNFLMPLLAAVGQPIGVSTISKRVRDEVYIHRAELPWRRNPSWLVLRVALQRRLQQALGDECGRICYKFFICAVLAELLKDCAGQLAPDLTLTLRAKLCRRLAKLELEKPGLTEPASEEVYSYLVYSIGTICRDIIGLATKQVDDAWETYKRDSTRCIPRLPSRAGEQALILSLPSSGQHLRSLLFTPLERPVEPIDSSLPLPDHGTEITARKLTLSYFDFAQSDMDSQHRATSLYKVKESPEDHCLKMAGEIENLFTTTLAICTSMPDQMSSFILNVFERWVAMDESAVTACPLLREYHPVFSPGDLDVLLLPTADELRRLQAVQTYLKRRCDGCSSEPRTIFSEPDDQSFATRYVQESPEAQHLRDLLDRIARDSLESRARKEVEWSRLRTEYDELSARIASGTCVCTYNGNGTRNTSRCDKCYHTRVRKRMKIHVHEDYLPTSVSSRAAVVLELAIPNHLQAYRNTTWRIFSDLGHPGKQPYQPVASIMLKDYSPLKPYFSGSRGITLASVEKSFIRTHYKDVRMKVDLWEVLRPFAANFLYYDQDANTWLGLLQKPVTFAQHCSTNIPKYLLPETDHPPPYIGGPTSYETVASQTKCPPEMSVHEFQALGRLLAGSNRRWMTLLVELGSANLNFSSEETMQMFEHIAHQAGPAEYTTDSLRDTHVIFRDQSFCQRLAEQIQRRLHIIRTNWRETYCMELLLTLALRLYELAEGTARDLALKILEQARDATMSWVSRLRNDIREAADHATAERIAAYGFWAALLCRKTFAIFTSSEDILTAADLECFIKASIALQENLVINSSALPRTLANMLMRDMKMAYRLRVTVRDSLVAHPESLSEAINASWVQSQALTGGFSNWHFPSYPDETWVTAVMTSNQQGQIKSQSIHYDIVEGHLLVDNMPLGRLPPDIMNSSEVQQLFGNRHLLTFSSPLKEMSHVLSTPINGNTVHFGVRDGRVVIRTLDSRALREYISPSLFAHDLPASLVEGCAHWLNLATGDLEVRRRPVIWWTRPGDWVISLTTHQATRRKSFLVDPHSAVHQRIRDIFREFEDPEHLTVYQPKDGRLSVELKRMDLSFIVNYNHLLECRELRAEIDPDQDAGTFYGFDSKIVVRDLVDNGKRSILTTWGPLSYERQGMHVKVRACPTGGYAKFEIDNILGRLTCPPEHRVLYTQALLHAVTSFALPDPLTASTGTEEACHILRSGACQPWTSLSANNEDILKAIAALSPLREYYPKGKRVLQTVHWNKVGLTATIQHDCLRSVVADVLLKSRRLMTFTEEKEAEEESLDKGTIHLYHRSLARRSLYERPMMSGCPVQGQDRIHNISDSFNSEAETVFGICQLLYQRPFTIDLSKDFAAVLQSLPAKCIGGYHNVDDNIQGDITSWIEDNIGERWGDLVTSIRAVPPDDQYKAMFRLGLLAFNPSATMDAIKILCAFLSVQELRTLEVPDHPMYIEFRGAVAPTREQLAKIINPEGLHPGQHQTQGQAQIDDQDILHVDTERLASHLLHQWPRRAPIIPITVFGALDPDETMDRLEPEWERLYANHALSEHAQEVQVILNAHAGEPYLAAFRDWPLDDSGTYRVDRGAVTPSLSVDLLRKTASQGPYNSSFEGETDIQGSHIIQKVDPMSDCTLELEDILSAFVRSPKRLWQQYGNDLMRSLDALRSANQEGQHNTAAPSLDAIDRSITRAVDIARSQLFEISDAFSAHDSRFQWLFIGQLWPRTTPTSILECLRSTDHHTFGDGMKALMVSYGLSITRLQWLLRLKDHRLKSNEQRLLEEWWEKGHTNWDPMLFPDWLLFEIDSNLLIREEQIAVARAIIAPSSESNSVLQLNMGKTSCIVPLALTVLANANQLSRLIVPRALLLQTAQTLQNKIGGLVGREITHIPFSRRTQTTRGLLELYAEFHHRILLDSGVILAIPEHIMSFKLSGFQRLADSKFQEARTMIDFQKWLEDNCRDILDESDFSLAVKTQLNYPSGQLRPVDGYPDRWLTAQALLRLVRENLAETCRLFPRAIEVITRPIGYPKLHILQDEVEDYLVDKLVTDICDGQTSVLQPPSEWSTSQKDDLHRVLSERQLDPDTFLRVTHAMNTASSEATAKSILVVRGLLVHRILFLCLKKRWHVQYGLHPNRHPVAVPFEAKGVPSEQAEFGHPDVVILLTCLAYYYEGLSKSQLKEGLSYILRSDDPAFEYDRWISGYELPDALRHWNLINADDDGQVEALWRSLRFSTTVTNHFMNVFVFPIHAKQFNVKLQASGWDLPLISLDPGTRGAKTTGFSGTNDNQRLLPLTIKQDDLPSLVQTNAEVLSYLLQKRNRQYLVATGGEGSRWSEHELLRNLGTQRIRVLIDAGAFILEMGNHKLIKEWLNIDTEAKAAVYFGSDNRAWVQYRGGKEPVPLLATPFADNMEECLVYLDEAHTRGTDLRLPRTARGAVTLALGQTKDHTVQAAMRLRQLATTQSVVFIAPPEVHQSILDIFDKIPIQRVDSSHVIRWLLEQTCKSNELLQPLHIAQGSEFCRRVNGLWEQPEFLADKAQQIALLDIIRLPERLTLDEQYGMSAGEPGTCLRDVSHPGLRHIVEELEKERVSTGQTGHFFSDLTMQEVEQEREVEFQVEEIREAQKPLHYTPLKFPGLHEDIYHFVNTGIVRAIHRFESASRYLSRTCTGRRHALRASKTNLFLSPEFSRTIKSPRTEMNEGFLRSVEYVLWEPTTQTALVVIPEEAEIIIPSLRAADSPSVHLFTYAAPTTKNMIHFCGLDYYVLPQLAQGYVLPEWLGIELGILGARLYSTFEEYVALEGYLQNSAVGMSATKVKAFLYDWLTVKHKTQDITMTPMGYICKGKPLHKDHPFFKTVMSDECDVRVVEEEASKQTVDRENETFEDDDGDSMAE